MISTYLIHIYLISPDDYNIKKSRFSFKILNYGHVIISRLYFKKDFEKVIEIINYHFKMNQVPSHE
jgi:hypothetical protein